MTSDHSGENRRLKVAPPPPPEQEHLPCPRCDSTNTKFCYYNNYNFSQPRHFCKSCRRYWTHGGTLRDIPIGGGTRKSAKRSRTNTNVASPGQSLQLQSTPVFLPLTANQATQMQFGCGGGDLVKGGNNNNLCGGGFTSLLNTQGPGGFLALSGFGSGFDDVGFGIGRGPAWPFSGVMGDVNGTGGSIVGGHGVNHGVGHGGGHGGMGNNNTWQFENGGDHNGFVGGDCFSWPDLAISTPGNALK